MKTPASFGRTLMASILLVLGARTASAHYCGPPVIRCRPGDIVTYYIISDMAEFGDSFYAVDFQDNPGVAPGVYYTPVARVAGMFSLRNNTVSTESIFTGPFRLILLTACASWTSWFSLI